MEELDGRHDLDQIADCEATEYSDRIGIAEQGFPVRFHAQERVVVTQYQADQHLANDTAADRAKLRMLCILRIIGMLGIRQLAPLIQRLRKDVEPERRLAGEAGSISTIDLFATPDLWVASISRPSARACPRPAPRKLILLMSFLQIARRLNRSPVVCD
jgi:hypothetical protein